MTLPQQNKPPRPLGLSLAILTVALIFGLIPALRIGLEFWLYYHFNTFEWTVGSGSDAIEPLMSGIDFNFDYTRFVTEGLLAVVVLALCILAWGGRPRWVRYALLWTVLLMDAVYILGMIVALVTPPTLDAGMSSGDSLANSLQVGYFVLLVVTTTYLVWYINREPARAFFRGSYRQDTAVPSELPDMDSLSGTRQT